MSDHEKLQIMAKLERQRIDAQRRLLSAAIDYGRRPVSGEGEFLLKEVLLEAADAYEKTFTERREA